MRRTKALDAWEQSWQEHWSKVGLPTNYGGRPWTAVPDDGTHAGNKDFQVNFITTYCFRSKKSEVK